MPIFCVTVGRTAEEYTTVKVDAHTEDAASEHVMALIKADEAAYHALLASAQWYQGRIYHERVCFVEET